MTSTGKGTAEEIRYRAADPSTLITASLPPFTAVYHRASGVTHLLAGPAPEILAALAHDMLSLECLRARLAEQFDLADEHALSMRLEELVAAGLIATA